MGLDPETPLYKCGILFTCLFQEQATFNQLDSSQQMMIMNPF